jgi:hypothetical protein
LFLPRLFGVPNAPHEYPKPRIKLELNNTSPEKNGSVLTSAFGRLPHRRRE